MKKITLIFLILTAISVNAQDSKDRYEKLFKEADASFNIQKRAEIKALKYSIKIDADKVIRTVVLKKQ